MIPENEGQVGEEPLFLRFRDIWGDCPAMAGQPKLHHNKGLGHFNQRIPYGKEPSPYDNIARAVYKFRYDDEGLVAIVDEWWKSLTKPIRHWLSQRREVIPILDSILALWAKTPVSRTPVVSPQ